jgi:hypothetical protein
MSSVSINGIGQNLFQYLQSLSAQGGSQTNQAGKVDSTVGTRGASAGHHHHHGNPAAFQAIQ